MNEIQARVIQQQAKGSIMLRFFVAAGPVVITAMVACSGATPGASPHDMSAAHHTREAEAHTSAAGEHAAKYDPSAEREHTRCAPTNQLLDGGACWTSGENPTAEHARTAEQHRRHAADHRAASAALREAEASACAGIAPDDRDISPFAHVEDITNVAPLREPQSGSPKVPMERTVGAVVTFRTVPGMTVEWLQRVVDCHLARNAAVGHVAQAMPDCPLVPKGAQARVASTGNGFAVAIRAQDPDAAAEILRRAERLRSAPK
jgi:hypothetical protein